ncbi:MAG: hypothetical protein AMXMBFR84_39730 [Candidatus Hydrogenedentota bacterium]
MDMSESGECERLQPRLHFHPLRSELKSRRGLVLPLVFTAAAAVVRFYALGRQSLWFDEIATWHTGAYSSLRDVVFADRSWNLYPPGYGVFTHYVMAVGGISEWMLRFPSAVAGTLSVPLLYLVALRAGNRRVAAISAGLLAFLLFPIYYSQEARPYALLQCLVLICVLAWTYVIEAWDARRPAPVWGLAVYAIAAIGCCYLHYFGLLFVFLQGLLTFALLLRKPLHLARATALFGCIALAFLPWLPSMWGHLRNQANGPQMPPVDVNVFVAFRDYLNSAFSHGQTGTWASWLVVWLVMLLLAFSFCGTVWAAYRGGRWSAALTGVGLLVAWLVIPFLLAYAKSVTSASIFTHRNLIISMPAVYLAVAFAVARIPVPKALSWCFAGMVVGVCALRLVTSGYYAYPHKDQFREAIGYVVDREGLYPDAELVVLSNLPFTYDYYLKRFGSDMRPALVAGRDGTDALDGLVANRNPKYVWYLSADPFPDDAFVNHLNEYFDVLEMQRFLRVNAYLLAPRTALIARTQAEPDAR